MISLYRIYKVWCREFFQFQRWRNGWCRLRFWARRRIMWSKPSCSTGACDKHRWFRQIRFWCFQKSFCFLFLRVVNIILKGVQRFCSVSSTSSTGSFSSDSSSTGGATSDSPDSDTSDSSGFSSSRSASSDGTEVEIFEEVMDYRTKSRGNAKPNSKTNSWDFLLKQGGNKVLKSTYLSCKSILHSF